MGRKVLSVILTFALVLSVFAMALPIVSAADDRLIGDADGNGKVSTADARIVLKWATGIETIDEEAKPFCDINHDEKITLFDALQILRGAVGLIKLEPSGAFKGVTGDDVFSTKEDLINYFNTNLNRVKTEKAGFTRSDTTTVSNFKVEKVMIGNTALSSTDKIVSQIFDKINEGSDGTTATTIVPVGESSYSKMSVEGEDFVSHLTAADVFGANVNINQSTGQLTIKIALADVDIPSSSTSSYSRVFNMENMEENSNSIMSNVISYIPNTDGELESLYKNGVIEAVFDYSTGNVISYKTVYNAEVDLAKGSFTVFTLQGVEYTSTSTSVYNSFIWE